MRCFASNGMCDCPRHADRVEEGKTPKRKFPIDLMQVMPEKMSLQEIVAIWPHVVEKLDETFMTLFGKTAHMKELDGEQFLYFRVANVLISYNGPEFFTVIDVYNGEFFLHSPGDPTYNSWIENMIGKVG